jgi:hypothetical protein
MDLTDDENEFAETLIVVVPDSLPTAVFTTVQDASRLARADSWPKAP